MLVNALMVQEKKVLTVKLAGKSTMEYGFTVLMQIKYPDNELND